VDSQASSTLIGQVFSDLSAHVGCIQVNALFYILFASLNTLAFFQVLLHTSAFFFGVGSEIWLMLFRFLGGSCLLAKHSMLLYHHRTIQSTQQLLYLEVYNLAAWFIFQHQVNKLYSFPPLV